MCCLMEISNETERAMLEKGVEGLGVNVVRYSFYKQQFCISRSVTVSRQTKAT